jgi:hypothetical protein
MLAAKYYMHANYTVQDQLATLQASQSALFAIQVRMYFAILPKIDGFVHTERWTSSFKKFSMVRVIIMIING